MRNKYLRKRTENGIYFAEIRNPETGTTKRISLSTRNKKEAEDIFYHRITQEEKDEAALKEMQEKAKDAPNLAFFRADYNSKLKMIIRKSSLTLYNYSYDSFTKSFLSWHPGADIQTFKISDITRNDIQLWIDDLNKDKASSNTVNSYIRNMKSLFNRAKKWGLLKQNPFDDIEMNRINNGAKEFISKEELDKIVAKEDIPVIKDIIIFAAYTGCRISEILNLKFSTVNLEGRQFSVINTENFQTKSGHNRTIYITDTIIKVLQRRIENKHPNSDLVFPNSKGFLFNSELINSHFKSAVQKAKINKKLTLHNLRHTAASWMIMAGIDLMTIAKQLGHSDTHLIDKVYGHLTQKYQMSQIEKIENI